MRGEALERMQHSPLPTLLDVLFCGEMTTIQDHHIRVPAEHCRLYARYKCRKCSMLVCGVHAKGHIHTCVKLNGAQ